MRTIQYKLPFSIQIAPKTSEDAKSKNKRSLMKGRPRRLAIGSAVIKASIRPSVMNRIDRICQDYLYATRPEFVRTSVEFFLNKYKDFSNYELISNESGEIEPGRCFYLKVPFSRKDLKTIGYQPKPKKEIEGYGLCLKLGVTRQQFINLAINEYIGNVTSRKN